jgi:plasmid stabilization system protein ParE
MTYRIIIEPTAEREIRSTVRWKTENASPTVAARWYNRLIQKIDMLRRHPSRCTLAAENDKAPRKTASCSTAAVASAPIGTASSSPFAMMPFTSFMYVRHTARDELEP